MDTLDLPEEGSLLQEMTPTNCADMPMGSTVNLKDARGSLGNRSYTVKKMPDNKCWMVDDLAYTGGGTNTYGDVVTAGTTNALGTGQLHQIDSPTAASTVWTVAAGVTDRFYTNNATEYVYNGTKCTTTPTGTGVMQSACAPTGTDGSVSGIILYNWCAAIGLDSTTTPACVAATNTGTGTGYAQTGIIGKTGGVGGESKGNTTTTNGWTLAPGNPSGVNTNTTGSICPAGWRLPVGEVSGTGNTNNEWLGLARSLNAGTNTAPGAADVANLTTGYMGYFQPQGTSISSDSGKPTTLGTAAFQAVSSGNFSPGYGLSTQSTGAYWWTPSLYSGTGAAYTYVSSGYVYPGTDYSARYLGLAVRCVF